MNRPKGLNAQPNEVATRVLLQSDLAKVLNAHNIDTMLDTPDYLLADMLIDFLAGYQNTVYHRDQMKAALEKTLEQKIIRETCMRCGMVFDYPYGADDSCPRCKREGR